MANLPIMYDIEDSSNVSACGFSEEERALYVRFHNGAIYRYEVEPDLFDLMMSAPSKGKFVWQYLRDRYNYSRVE